MTQLRPGYQVGSATLSFYPVQAGEVAPAASDVVISLASEDQVGPVKLMSSDDTLTRSLRLPQNIERAYLDIYAQSQGVDEEWFTCVPDDLADKLNACPNTAFRETLVSIDGEPAGIAPVYPWIYTGGVDPFLWRPSPGIQTLNFEPYRVDLSPFAALLSDGKEHTIGLQVYNAHNYFSVAAALLLFVDHGSDKVTGAVSSNTLTTDPSLKITNHIHTTPQGRTQGTIGTRVKRDYEVVGFIESSRGRIETSTKYSIVFSNEQVWKIFDDISDQSVKQRTTIHATTNVKNGADGTTSISKRSKWPLAVMVNQSGNGNTRTFVTTVTQGYNLDKKIKVDGQTAHSSLSNSTDAADTATVDMAKGVVIGNKGQHSVQTFDYSSSTGDCFSRKISAVDDRITSIGSDRCPNKTP